MVIVGAGLSGAVIAERASTLLGELRIRILIITIRIQNRTQILLFDRNPVFELRTDPELNSI